LIKTYLAEPCSRLSRSFILKRKEKGSVAKAKTEPGMVTTGYNKKDEEKDAFLTSP